MNYMKNPSTIVEWSGGQKFAAQFLGTGTFKTNKQAGTIAATARQVSMAILMQLTPEGARAFSEFMFFGKHLKPAPAHIEKILLQREAWDTVYQTCHAKIREVIDEYVDGGTDQATAVEALRFLSRVCIQACDRMEHYDLCYSLEFTVDEDFD